MTFRDLPKPYDILHRVTYAAAYLGTLLFGAASITLTPVTISGALGGDAAVYVWATLAALGGLGGLVACILARSHVELVALPLVIGGMGGYVVAVWSLVGAETITRAPQALALAVLVLLWLARAVVVVARVWMGRRRVEQRRRGRTAKEG